MAKITRYERSYEPAEGIPEIVVETDICCNTKGVFYCVIPDSILEFFTAANKSYHTTISNGLFKDTKGRWCYGCRELEKLKSTLHEAAVSVIHIEEKTEDVIAYEIVSRGQFAYDSNGNVYPRRLSEDMKWTEDERFESGARTPWPNSAYIFGVELAAKVYHKVTRTCGGHSSVEYTVMRPKNKDCIQWKLNAWNTKPDLDKAKFIPYSDKAALFFYEMLEGIARLNKRLQDTTFEAENLMKCIEAGTFFLPNNTND